MFGLWVLSFFSSYYSLVYIEILRNTFSVTVTRTKGWNEILFESGESHWRAHCSLEPYKWIIRSSEALCALHHETEPEPLANEIEYVSSRLHRFTRAASDTIKQGCGLCAWSYNWLIISLDKRRRWSGSSNNPFIAKIYTIFHMATASASTSARKLLLHQLWLSLFAYTSQFRPSQIRTNDLLTQFASLALVKCSCFALLREHDNDSFKVETHVRSCVRV